MELGRLAGNRVLRAGTLVLTGCLALSACASGKGEDKGIEWGGSHADRAPASASATPNRQRPILTFDALGGGSSVIMVYPGVTESARDTEHNGTYYDGNKVFAECKVTEGGRTKHSDTDAGEEKRSSDDWVRIQGTPGEIQYASAVYVEKPAELLAQLPEC